MITVIAGRVRHDSGMRVALKFPYDQEVVDLVRKLPDARWSKRMQCWHIADSDDVITLLLRTLSKNAFIDYSALRKPDLADRVSAIRKERQEKYPQVKSAEEIPAEDLTRGKTGKTDHHNIPGTLSIRGKEDIGRYSLWLEFASIPGDHRQNLHLDDGDLSKVCLAEGGFRM